MIAVLGVCKKEQQQAAQWLSWCSYLHPIPLVVSCTRSVDIEALRPRAPWATFAHIPDEQERGYPGSASHLFVRSLEYAEKHHAGDPVLWLETDAIPLKRGWFDEIAQEYAMCGTPFMGHLEPFNYRPHMAGVGVYSPEWRRLSPRLARAHLAPDTPAFGPGKGQGWDTYAGRDILPQASQAKTIQQVWRWDGDITKIWTSTALFHQDKGHKLIKLLGGSGHTPW